MKIISHSEWQTMKIAQDFARDLLAENFAKNVLVFGDMGAGKSTFARGLGHGLNIQTNIQSPTFTMLAYHDLPGKKRFIHIDLYRMESGSSFPMEILEYLEDKNSIIFCEWAKYFPEEFLPAEMTKVTIKQTGKNDRIIEINNV